MAPDRATARHHPPLGEANPTEDFKRAAAEAAAALIEDGMRVGLGTGSTVAYLLPALAERGLRGLRCAATSPATERAARALGLIVEDLDALGELDIAIDGADQVDAAGWLVKGGGAAQTREKIVAAAARRFVVIVSAEKASPRCTRRCRWSSCASASGARSPRSATRGCAGPREAPRKTRGARGLADSRARMATRSPITSARSATRLSLRRG